MGQLQYPTEREFHGPWLFNQDDFEELDIIINKIDSQLFNSFNKEFEGDDIKKRYNYDRREKKFQLNFKNGSRLTDESIKGLLKDRATLDHKPEKFYANIEYGYNNRFKFEISNIYGGQLNYDLICSDLSVKDEMQYEMDRWLERKTPAKFLKFWTDLGPIIGMFLFAILVFLSLFTFTKSYYSYKEILIDKSHKILGKGIDSINRDKAIELLLMIETNYEPEGFVAKEKPKSPIFVRLLVLGLFLFVVSIIRPRTTIGLGKRKLTYNFYKYWIKFVTITLPVALIIAPFWQMIIEWLY